MNNYYIYFSPVQRSQFDELQAAWRHQCAADIKGNGSSFKLSMYRYFKDIEQKMFGLVFEISYLSFIIFYENLSTVLKYYILVSSSDMDSSSSVSPGDCRICVPSLNMCFSTNKLQSLKIVGNIFDASKLTRPLTIQDYISILIDNDKYLDSELAHIISNIPSLVSRYKCLNNNNSDYQSTNDKDTSG